jgi:DNA-binding transcriptional LysR family regulator
MQDFLAMKQGEIHMGGSTIPGEYILPKIIGNFREEHPLVSVVLSISDTNDIEGRVLNGHLELGIVGSRHSHRNLIHHKLWKDELVLATSKKK